MQIDVAKLAAIVPPPTDPDPLSPAWQDALQKWLEARGVVGFSQLADPNRDGEDWRAWLAAGAHVNTVPGVPTARGDTGAGTVGASTLLSQVRIPWDTRPSRRIAC
jgi:hypothetical protein